MRIAIAAPFPPLRGGIAQFSPRLMAALGKLGCECIPMSYRRLYPKPLFPGTSQYRPGQGEEDAPFAPLDSVWPPAWLRTRRWFRRTSLDAVAVAWWHPFFAPCLLASIPSDIPCVAICHNVLPHEGFPLSRTLTRIFLERAGNIITHSRADADIARDLVPKARVTPLYLPLYDQYSELAPRYSKRRIQKMFGFPENGRVLLFFGLVRPYKGLEDLVSSLSRLDPSISLLAVGEPYMDTAPIRELADALGLSERFKWVDRFVDDAELASFFRVADALVLPYREATQSAVGQVGLAFGLPMVVSDAGGLPDLVDSERTGTVFSAGDPRSLADAIDRCLLLLEEQDLAERIAAKAGHFSWQRYAETLLEHLE